MLAVIDEALNLITSLVNYAALKESTKYIDRVRSVQLAINAEKNQPIALINDAKIERLEEQLKVEFQALKTSVMAGLNGNNK